MLFIWALAFAGVMQEQEIFDVFVTQVRGREFAYMYNEWSGTRQRGAEMLSCRTFIGEMEVNITLRILTPTSVRAAADPISLLPGSLGSWCHEHNTMHERLDIIEEKVIKTVEHLESEVKSLLSIISETTSDLPTATGAPLIDIFDDAS